MALALDGNASGALNGNPVTATLTTTQSDDLIVAIVSVFSNNATLTSQSTTAGTIKVTGGGLTWALRTRKRVTTTVSSLPLIIEEWIAHASSPLTSQVITATQASAGSNNYYCLEVFGISGADIDALFDTNASLPAIVSVAGSGGSSSHTVTGISTTNADTFEIAALATSTGGSGTAITADSGFTKLDNVWANATFGGQQSEYKINSAALASVSQNVFANFSSVSTNYIALVDAIAVAPVSTRSGPKFVNSGGGLVTLGTSMTPALPSVRTNGNLLLCHVSITSSTAVPVWPSGWTVIETWTIGTQVGTKAYRYVDGTETAPTITWSGGVTGCMSQVLQFSGTAIIHPIGASAHNSATSTSVTCSTITTTRNDSLVLNYLDTGDVLPAPLDTPWRPRSSGGVNSGAVYGCWHICDEYIPTSGTASASPNTTIYVSSAYLNFTTEILAPGPPATGSGGAALIAMM